MHTLPHSVPQTPQQATTNPCLGWRLLETHGQVWVSLLWGHCSFLLCPRMHKVSFVPSKSVYPQSCVSSGGSMVGLTATSSKKAYATIRSAVSRAPAPSEFQRIARRDKKAFLSEQCKRDRGKQ